MTRRTAVVLTISMASFVAGAQIKAAPGVFGDWREPGGSVIRVAPCGDAVCAALVALSQSAPSRTDGQNPDPALRLRPLCGLRIGYGFHLTEPTRAEDGHLYDPKSGKTYYGEMTGEGSLLKLRGYVGVRAFGRTETWTRIGTLKATCS